VLGLTPIPYPLLSLFFFWGFPVDLKRGRQPSRSSWPAGCPLLPLPLFCAGCKRGGTRSFFPLFFPFSIFSFISRGAANGDKKRFGYASRLLSFFLGLQLSRHISFLSFFFFFFFFSRTLFTSVAHRRHAEDKRRIGHPGAFPPLPLPLRAESALDTIVLRLDLFLSPFFFFPRGIPGSFPRCGVQRAREPPSID